MHGSHQKNSINAWKIVAFVLIVAVAAVLTAGGLYANYRFNQQQGEINQLTARRDDLARQLNDAKAEKSQTKQDETSTQYTSDKGVTVTVTSPDRSAGVASPLSVAGEVPGSWSSEGQFPVVLKNDAGLEVARGAAKLDGDWQTTDLVGFTTELVWSTPQSGAGTLVLQKDNPSGLAANDDSVEIPINF